MEQTTYERPREKLQHKGVLSLTNAELLQVIIGSGSRQVPVAKVARRVGELLSRLDTNTTYAALVKVQGIGTANALRIIASLELGKRLAGQPVPLRQLDVTHLQKSRQLGGVYGTFNGVGQGITTTSIQRVSSESSIVVARRICAKVLADGAWGVCVAVGCRSGRAQPGTFELSLLADLKELTSRLHIRLISYEYVAKSTRVYLYKATP